MIGGIISHSDLIYSFCDWLLCQVHLILNLIIQSRIYGNVCWWLKSRYERASTYMKERYCSPDGSLGQDFILEGYAHELAVKRKGQGSKVHVEEHTEHSFLLESAAIWLTHRIVRMPQLTQSVIRESKFVIRERLVHIECFLCCHADLQLMLGTRIGYDLKVMDTVEKWSIRGDCPEVVVSLVQERMPEIWTECDILG